MKKIILLCIVVAFAASCKKDKPKDEVVLNATPTAVNEMPALTVTQTDSTKVFFKDLKGKVLIVFFNPDCDHCQREAKLISEHKDVFKDYQVYFVTPDKMDAIVKFASEYNLLNDNFHFARANVVHVINAVGPINSVPTFFAFNDQKLIARNEGEVTIEKLAEVLN